LQGAGTFSHTQTGFQKARWESTTIPVRRPKGILVLLHSLYGPPDQPSVVKWVLKPVSGVLLLQLRTSFLQEMVFRSISENSGCRDGRDYDTTLPMVTSRMKNTPRPGVDCLVLELTGSKAGQYWPVGKMTMEFISSGLLGFIHAMEAETIPQLQEVPETYYMEARK